MIFIKCGIYKSYIGRTSIFKSESSSIIRDFYNFTENPSTLLHKYAANVLEIDHNKALYIVRLFS